MKCANIAVPFKTSAGPHCVHQIEPELQKLEKWTALTINSWAEQQTQSVQFNEPADIIIHSWPHWL